MQESMIAILYPIAAVVLSVFLVYRLKLGRTREGGGKGFIYAGLAFILVTALTNLMQHHSGYQEWFLSGIYPIIDLGEAIALISGMIFLVIGLALYFNYWDERDIEVSNHLEKLRLLDTIQQESRYPYPILELLDRVLKSVLSGLGEEAGAVFLLDRSERKFVLATALGLSTEETALLEYYPYGRNIVTQAIEEQVPMISSDFRSLGGKAQLAASKFNSILVVPFISGRKKLGALLLFSQESRHFSREYISIISPISEWLSEKIEVGQLNRDIIKSRRELELRNKQFQNVVNRLGNVLEYDDGFPTAEEFCTRCIGLAGCEKAWLVGLHSGRLLVHGGTETGDDFSDNFKSAVINAVNRKKAVILNQEATDESGKSFISKSSLLLPADRKGNAVLLRKSGAVISISHEELQVLEMIAAVAGMVIANLAADKSNLMRRKGIRLISDILQIKITRTRHEKILAAIVSRLTDTLSDEYLILLFKKDRAVLRLMADENLEPFGGKIEIAFGEGSIGRSAALRNVSANFEYKNISENLAEFSDENRQSLLELFGERKYPNFQGDYPVIVKDQTEFVVTVFGFGERAADSMEQHQLLSLLLGLLNLRFEIALTDRLAVGERKEQLPETVSTKYLNAVNDAFTDISGYCQLALQDENASGKVEKALRSIQEVVDDLKNLHKEMGTIISEPVTEKAKTTNLNIRISSMLEDNSISGNLHMIGGRPLTVNLKLDKIPDSFLPAEKIDEFIKSIFRSFANNVNEDEVLTISTYRDGDHVYLDMSKHRENFPPVQPVVGFGHFSSPTKYEERFKGSKFLKILSEYSGEFAYDRHSSIPSYYSFKIPLVPPDAGAPVTAKIDQLSILAVDDQAIILDLLEGMCQSMGYKIYLAKDGREGLKLFETYQPDIIITDLAMPGMSGIEMAARIRAISSDVPIIIITGWGVSIDHEKLRKIGIQHILYKPFRLEQLSDLISQIKISRTAR